jgi:hypothetical protein
MKYLLALPLLAVFILPNCALVRSARDKLEQMPQESYVQLLATVEEAAALGGKKLAEVLGENRLLALKVTQGLKTAVITDRLKVADVLKDIVDSYSRELNLEAQHLDFIRDGMKAIDAAVGQVRLGIDGKLSEREKGLVVALLDGLERGLS